MDHKQIGRYEIVGTLGRGAMGVVYLALDPLIDRQVALKTLRIDLDAEMTDEFRARFFREAKAAGRLSHPNIVTVHDVGEDQHTGLVFIAMEHIRGHDLLKVLSSGYRFRYGEAARIVADVALALDYAHSMGVVHRDIKPANILLTEESAVKIMDFGVARLESSNLTTEGQFIGTPNFMSPEQITGKQVDARSDIFSLGVVLFLLLTGKRPFASDTVHGVTMKIVQEQAPIPSTLTEGLLPAFNPVVMRCLEKDPARRYQNGRDLAEVLQALRYTLAHTDPSETEPARINLPDASTQAQQPAGPGPGVMTVSSTPAAGSGLPEIEPVDTQAARPPTTAGGSQLPEVESLGLPDIAEVPPASATSASSGYAARTRISSPRTGPIPVKQPVLAGRYHKLVAALHRLPMPDIMRREVATSWVLRILGVWALLWIVIIAVLALLRNDGPFPAPSVGTSRNLRQVVQSMEQARRLLADGNARAAEHACWAALDQAPYSHAARRLAGEARQMLQAEQTSAKNQERITELLDQARELYRARDYDRAALVFADILSLDEAHEVAREYLALIDERRPPIPPEEEGATEGAAGTPATPTPTRSRRSTPVPTPRPVPTIQGEAEIYVHFDSPINAGTITVSCDSQEIALIPFDFTKVGLLKIKRKGTGQVKKTLTIPSGRHLVSIELIDAERGSLGAKGFSGAFRPGSEWTLRVNLPPDASRASFHMVKRR